MINLIFKLFMFSLLTCFLEVSPLLASEAQEWEKESYYKASTVILSEKISEKSEEYYKNIAKYIAENKIQNLDLSNNNINKQSFEILAQAIAHHPTLEKVSLRNSLDSSKALIFLRYLLENPASKITKLDLSHNNIYGWGIINIDAFLKQSQNLEYLDLSFNPIESGVAPQLRAGLAENKSLRTLNLEHVDLNGLALSEIIEGLIVNPTLKSLILSKNPLIGDEGAISIKLYALENNIVESLDLNECGIASLGLKKIAEGLRANKTLKMIDLRGNNFKQEEKEEFISSISETITVQLEVNPYQDKMDLLSRSLEEGRIESVAELVAFYNKMGPMLKKHYSVEELQELHDNAGRILFSVPSQFPGAKIQERSISLPSRNDFYSALEHVLN